MENEIYDLIIVGGGPAGLTAGIYACRARLKTLLLEKYVFGGQVATTFEIKNYPGFEDINGPDLIDKMLNQAKNCGLETVNDNVLDFDFRDEIKVVKTEFGGVYYSRSIILCMGADARKLGVKGEDKFKGMGVSYCAICDGALYKDKVVAVVGGGDSALEDASYLSSIAKKVYLIHRRNEFRGQEILQERVFNLVKDGKIELVLSSEVSEVFGTNKVEGIKVHNFETNEVKNLALDGLFITVGRDPDTVSIDAVEKDEKGYILTNEAMETNIKGVFAAGDCRKKELRQIVTACSDGAIAGTKANIYVKTMKRKQNV